MNDGKAATANMREKKQTVWHETWECRVPELKKDLQTVQGGEYISANESGNRSSAEVADIKQKRSELLVNVVCWSQGGKLV